MSHLNASGRAAWLDKLASGLAAEGDDGTARTLIEIASWIRDRGDSDGLPPDTVWVHVDGPALYYFDCTVDSGAVTLSAIRLDTRRQDDVRTLDTRQLVIARALMELATHWLTRLIDNPARPIIPGVNE